MKFEQLERNKGGVTRAGSGFRSWIFPAVAATSKPRNSNSKECEANFKNYGDYNVLTVA